MKLQPASEWAGHENRGRARVIDVLEESRQRVSDSSGGRSPPMKVAKLEEMWERLLSWVENSSCYHGNRS